MAYSARLFGPPHALRQRRPRDRLRRSTVLAVARPSASRLPRKASTSAVPTTAPLAFSAIARAASGVRMPKPTQTGSLVCRLMRATASPTAVEIRRCALPVMPVIDDVIDKARRVREHRRQALVVGGRRRQADEIEPGLHRRQAQFGVFLRRQVDDDQAVDAGGLGVRRGTCRRRRCRSDCNSPSAPAAWRRRPCGSRAPAPASSSASCRP